MLFHFCWNILYLNVEYTYGVDMFVIFESYFKGLDEPFPTVQFDIEPVECGDDEFGVTAKICIPWARGFNRHIHPTYVVKLSLVLVASNKLQPLFLSDMIQK